MGGTVGASRVIESESGNVVAFSEAVGRMCSNRELKAEAAALSKTKGGNAYTEFLLRHGKRPDRDQAAVIGHLMGVRVRPRTAAFSRAKPRQRGRRSTELRNMYGKRMMD